MRAKDTLEWMADLKVGLTRPGTHRYLDGMLKSIARKAQGTIRAVEGSTVGEGFAHDVGNALTYGEAYFLSKDMLPVVLWGAQQLPDDASFERDLWPSPAGFVLLEEPLIEKETRGRDVVTKALVWYPNAEGTVIAHFTDADDMRDEVNVGLVEMHGKAYGQVRSMGRLQLHHMDYAINGRKVGPQMIATDGRVDEDPYGLPPMATTANPQRFLLSFLLMLNQTITSTEREHLNPKQAARFAKHRLPSSVTVVQMRRVAGAARAKGESTIEWAHRWIVKGHWRNQPYKGEGGTVEHRRIWIAPFIKGPEDAPLKVSQKVYALTR